MILQPTMFKIRVDSVGPSGVLVSVFVAGYGKTPWVRCGQLKLGMEEYHSLSEALHLASKPHLKFVFDDDKFMKALADPENDWLL